MWETHDISENLRQVGGGATLSAGALEPELLDAGEGGRLEAERRGDAGRAADSPANLDARPPIFRSIPEGSWVFSVANP
jgi:hypothetical protein